MNGIYYISKKEEEKCDFQVLTRIRQFLPGADKADFLMCHLHFQITHYMIEAADVSHFRLGGGGEFLIF